MSFPLDEAALERIESRRAAGASLAEAAGNDLDVRVTPSGATLIVHSGKTSRDALAAALRFLAQVTRDSARAVAVLGEFDSTPVDALEEHDYIGRLIVRLNVGQLVAVGTAARHIQSAAGLEGSWDGESVIVATPEEAYDLLRGQISQDDVVLVMAAERVGLTRLADRLSGITE